MRYIKLFESKLFEREVIIYSVTLYKDYYQCLNCVSKLVKDSNDHAAIAFPSMIDVFEKTKETIKELKKNDKKFRIFIGDDGASHTLDFTIVFDSKNFPDKILGYKMIKSNQEVCIPYGTWLRCWYNNEISVEQFHDLYDKHELEVDMKKYNL